MPFPPSPSAWARRAWSAGSAASLLSAAVLAWRGARELGRPAAPVDAVSHWVHGARAYAHGRADLRHALLGFAIHHASSVFWGALYAAVLPRRPPRAAVLVAAGAVTAIAAATDLRLVPERLSPGFQHELSDAGVVAVYLGVAAGLAVAGLRWRRLDPARPRRLHY